MKSVMLSIQPKYCELIASGKKTIEVRKTAPKLEMPFKCYIYETKRKVMKSFIWKNGDGLTSIPNGAKVIPISKTQRRVKYNARGRGKVIGEFVCDEIMPVMSFCSEPNAIKAHELPFIGMTDKEVIDYLGNGKDGYGWHISDLKIYDTPKELREFRNLQGQPIQRPFQSWGYVCSNE